MPPSASDVYNICNKAFHEIHDKSSTEIAFFGGSFTAIPREYMIELLKAANNFIGTDMFHGIRISTRPDCINREILTLLKSYNVTAIELGCQSMDESVLNCNNRGHSPECVKTSSKLIQDFGFELGLQMMVGLYGSSISQDIYTAKEIIKSNPKTVRIYPTVILKGTALAKLFLTGEYVPMSLESAVELTAKLILSFMENNIDIIKVGLHSSDLLESEMVGGIYHPAFRELCDNFIFKDKIKTLLYGRTGSYSVYVAKNSISKAIGQRKSNILFFKNMNVDIKIFGSPNLTGYNINLTERK